MRFGKDDYIFAWQWNGHSLICPAKGKNTWDVSDVNGVKIVQEMIAAARQGGGFVEYVLPQFAGRRNTNKFSYAMARHKDLMALKQLNGELSAGTRELEKVLEEIKTLKGILPICANCKKSRDDEGYLKQIESFIQEHSEAEFSHSICPECALELYPEFIRRKNVDCTDE